MQPGAQQKLHDGHGPCSDLVDSHAAMAVAMGKSRGSTAKGVPIGNWSLAQPRKKAPSKETRPIYPSSPCLKAERGKPANKWKPVCIVHLGGQRCVPKGGEGSNPSAIDQRPLGDFAPSTDWYLSLALLWYLGHKVVSGPRELYQVQAGRKHFLPIKKRQPTGCSFKKKSCFSTH